MPRVLLGSTAEEDMLDVKLLLDAEGCEVRVAGAFEAVLRAARADGIDVVVVDEALDGGTGAELCALLNGSPGRPALLYLGDAPVRGADASAPRGQAVIVAEVALDLVKRRANSDRAEPTEPSLDEETLGWAVDANPLSTARRQEPAERRNAAPSIGKEILAALVAEGIDALLARVRGADYFAILGVEVSASPEEIRAAHAARTEALKAMGKESPAGRAHLEEVRTAIDEALDVLGDPRLRIAYTRNRPG